MSKEYYKKRIADKRIEIVTLRTKIVKIKADKKRKITSLTQYIKNASTASNKATYRKQKISELERFTREEESVKKKIESVKREIEGLKKSLANSK